MEWLAEIICRLVIFVQKHLITPKSQDGRFAQDKFKPMAAIATVWII